MIVHLFTLKNLIPCCSVSMIEEHILECVKSFDSDEQDSVRLLVVDIAIAAATVLTANNATNLNETLVEPLVTGRRNMYALLIYLQHYAKISRGKYDIWPPQSLLRLRLLLAQKSPR